MRGRSDIRLHNGPDRIERLDSAAAGLRGRHTHLVLFAGSRRVLFVRGSSEVVRRAEEERGRRRGRNTGRKNKKSYNNF